MKRKIYILTLLLIAALAPCLFLRRISSGQAANYERAAVNSDYSEKEPLSTPMDAQDPTPVSMISLIANPKDYDGRYVRITGFVKISFEGNAVYLHQEDYKFAIFKNALWLSIDKADQQGFAEGNQKYVIIEGTFDAGNLGHRRLFSGSIKNIKRFQVRGG